MRRPGKPKSPWDWALPALIGFLIWLALMSLRGGFEARDQETFLLLLCDAFFVPGVLISGIGMLVLVESGGAFDALHYGLQKLFSLMRSEEKRALLPRTYYDFVTQRHSQVSRKPAALLIVGLCYLAAAGIALILYARVTVW